MTTKTMNSNCTNSGLPTESGARKDVPMWTYLTEYFPRAFIEVVRVAVEGNKKHNPGSKRIYWDRSKSSDHLDAAFRHMWDHALGDPVDSDGTYHLAKAVWRLSAALQEHLEGAENAISTQALERAKDLIHFELWDRDERKRSKRL